MPESTQHKLDRIRPPRVQITYDVETRGSFVKMELPFVVGIMADLSTKGGVKDEQGNPVALRDKKYMEVDRDNFDDIMASIKPSVALNGGSTTYTFESLEDFTPIRLLKPANTALNKVEPDDKTPLGLARADYVRRTRLSDMVAKLDGNVPLQKKFLEALKDANRATFKTTVTEIETEAGASLTAGSVADPKVAEKPKVDEKPKGGDKK
jgi:type VI secretion system protein ImpB